MLDDAREQARERAVIEAERKANTLRDEFGELAWDTMEEYFPEQAKARRRQQRVRALAIGLVVGLAVRTFASRWLGR